MRLKAQIKHLSHSIDLKKQQNRQCYGALKQQMASAKVLLIALASGFVTSYLLPKLIHHRKPQKKLQKLRNLISRKSLKSPMKSLKKVDFLVLGMTALKLFLNIHPIGRRLGPLRRLLV